MGNKGTARGSGGEHNIDLWKVAMNKVCNKGVQDVTMKPIIWYVNFKTIKEYLCKKDKTTWLVQFPIK